MGLKANARGIKQIVKEGDWNCVCVGYVDLGTQHNDYDGKDKRVVMLFWDIPEQRMMYNGKDVPSRISNRYTLSMHEKSNLRKMLEDWVGPMTKEQAANFDLDSLIGQAAELRIVHKEKANGTGPYASVKRVDRARGNPRLPLETTPLRYVTTDGISGNFIYPGPEVPEWIRKIIAVSGEYKAAKKKAAEEGRTIPDVVTMNQSKAVGASGPGGFTVDPEAEPESDQGDDGVQF